MRVNELRDYLQRNFNYPFYANQFPAIESKEIGMVRVFPVQTSSRQINRINAQALIQCAHPQTGESKAWEIYEAMRMKTRFEVGTTKVIMCATSQPEFINQGESGVFHFSINFNFITEQ